MSKSRPAKSRAHECSKPGEKIIQLGLSKSSRRRAGFPFEEVDKFQHVNAVDPAVQKVAHRKGQAAIVHGHDDFIHVVALAEPQQIAAAVDEASRSGIARDSPSAGR